MGGADSWTSTKGWALGTHPFGPGLAVPGALSACAFGLEPVLRLNITRHALTPPGWTPGLTPPAEWAALLAALRAPLGVHAIMGNHDWWEDKAARQAGDGETVSHRALRAAGIPVHASHAIRLEKPGTGFWLAGLEDQMALLPGARWGRARRRGLDDLPPRWPRSRTMRR